MASGQKDVVQAVVVADTFDDNFVPISDSIPLVSTCPLRLFDICLIIIIIKHKYFRVFFH